MIDTTVRGIDSEIPAVRNQETMNDWLLKAAEIDNVLTANCVMFIVGCEVKQRRTHSARIKPTSPRPARYGAAGIVDGKSRLLLARP